VTLVFERQFQGDSSGYGTGPLIWVLPEVLVVGSAGKWQAWDVSTGVLKWELADKTKIDAVAAGDGVFYIAEDDIHMAGLPPRLRVIDGNTGQEILEGINSATPFRVTSMVWAPAVRRLAVVTFDNGVLVYDEKLALVHQVPCKIKLPIASVCGGELLLSNREGLSLGVDLRSGSRYPLSGDVSKEEQDDLTVDDVSTSSAYHHPDGSFIQVLYNSWSTDRIRFFQGITPQSPLQPGQGDPHAVVSPVAAGAGLRVEVDSGKGHIVTDVCWPGNWLAVVSATGGDGLAFFSTATGKRLTIQGQAAASKAYDLRFSPDGEKVAALAEKGHLYVWEVKVHR
jgi:WD40 repeat protein